jgi:hypothetical protein
MAACTDGLCSPVNLTRQDKRKAFEHNPTKIPEISQSLHNSILSLGASYIDHQINLDQFGKHIRDLWDELIHLAKIIPFASSEHDRLVTLLLEVRELGTFSRTKKDVTSGEEEREEAILPDGQRLWTDLPYLVQEFHNSWINESMRFEATERENIAVLTAKLCVVGVCSDQLSCCALWLFKETLEVTRPLIPSSQEANNSENSTPSVVELLPACLAWLRISKLLLAKLSVANHDPASIASGANLPISTTPGDLATNANILQPGFSLPRWLFWRQRFKDLYRCGDERVAKLAKACFEEAVLTGLHVGLDIPGEKTYLENLFKALDEELAKREFQGCVGPEDVEIDMEWTEET